jgi:uncharacterized membrane protein (DUF441 family)
VKKISSKWTQFTKFNAARTAMYCLAVWLAVWAFFLAIRFSGLDARDLPAAGPLLLLCLAYAVLAPIAAGALSLVALIRQPRVRLGWIALALAIIAFVGQGAVFMATKWL